MSRLLSFLLPTGIAVLVLSAAVGLYTLAWGFARLLVDFWPLDSSRVGPNLVASIVVIVLVVAHNEFVVEKRAAARHESHKQALEDGLKELLHPTEEAEANIANDVEAQFRTDILDRLDVATPGGIGDLAAKLNPITSKETT